MDKPLKSWMSGRRTACFLMSARLVASRFFEIFATEQFDLNEETAFAQQSEALVEVRKQCRSRRGLFPVKR